MHKNVNIEETTSKHKYLYLKNNQELNNDEDKFMVIAIEQVKSLASSTPTLYNNYFIWNSSACGRKKLGIFDQLYIA